MTDEPENRPREGAMDRSGLGLLPGMTVAMLIGVGLIMGVLIEQWWVVPVVFVSLVILTIVVIAIIIGVMEEEGEGKLRRYIPGL